MKNIRTIFCKEFKRFFTDYRMVLALFLPGILIFALYTIMGALTKPSAIQPTPTNETYHIAYVAEIDGFEFDEYKPNLFKVLDVYMKTEESGEKTNDAKYYPIKNVEEEINKAKDRIANKDKYKVEEQLDLLVIFTKNFDTIVSKTEAVAPIDIQPSNITLFYNAANEISSHVYSVVNPLITQTYNQYTQNLEDGKYVNPNLSPDGSNVFMQKMLGFVFPMVTIALLFSTVISIVPETISGEKERGTLASVLVTPIKRSDLAIGKISALTVIALMSGVVSFLGIFFSLQMMFAGTGGALSINVGQGVSLFFLVVSTLVLFVTIGLFVSTFAKSIKEASSLLGPFLMILMMVSLVPSFVDMRHFGYAFIPIVNLSTCMANILQYGVVDVGYLLITMGVNIALTAVIIFIITRLFKNEKIMY